MLRRHWIRSCPAAPVAAVALGACATWGPVGSGAAATLPPHLPPEVRVRVADRPEPFLLRAPTLVGDSLVGWQIARPGGRTGVRVAVPVRAVTEVSAQHGSAGLTALAVAVGLAAVAVLVSQSGVWAPDP